MSTGGRAQRAGGPYREQPAGATSNGGGEAGGEGLARRDETERAFLALCIASPDEGARALAGLDIDDAFSSELLRRAARHLRDGHLTAPMADLPAGEGGAADADNGPLTALLAELVVKAGHDRAAPAMLEVQRLQLELARLDRSIQQARGSTGGDVSALATRRGEVKQEFDAAYARALEQTGD